MRFTIRKNKLLAIGLLATQILTQMSEEMEGTQKMAVSITAAAAAAVLQVLAHKRNPDGSACSAPGTPTKEEN